MHAEKSHHVRSQVAAMSSNCCSFCQRANPSDAKYCNECGGALGLKPCKRCGAVDDSHATQCHVCGSAFGDACAAHRVPMRPTFASSAPSIVRAIETVEADLPSAAKSAASHNTHPLLIAALLIGVSASTFVGDEQAPGIQAAPTLLPNAGTSTRLGEHRVRAQDVRMFAASHSPRASGGTIDELSASQSSIAVPPAVGPRESLARREVSSSTGRLFVPAERVEAKLRYRSPATAATVSPLARGFRVTLDEPAYGVAVGQAAVLYEEDAIVGAGLISASR